MEGVWKVCGRYMWKVYVEDLWKVHGYGGQRCSLIDRMAAHSPAPRRHPHPPPQDPVLYGALALIDSLGMATTVDEFADKFKQLGYDHRPDAAAGCNPTGSLLGRVAGWQGACWRRAWPIPLFPHAAGMAHSSLSSRGRHGPFLFFLTRQAWPIPLFPHAAGMAHRFLNGLEAAAATEGCHDGAGCHDESLWLLRDELEDR